MPEPFDIEEVKTTSNEEGKVVYVEAGEVKTWKRLELSEKAKTRPYIVGAVISLWIACVVAGLYRWATAGDISLLISSPVLLVNPLHEILKFYFKE